MKKARVIILAAALVLASSWLSACEGDNPLKHCVVSRRAEKSTEKAREEADSSWPALKSFSAKTLDGETLTEKDLAGRDLTVINIWQTTCGPCIDEMPELAKLAASLPERVSLITWCLDAPGSEETVADILKDAGYESATIISGSGDLEKICHTLMYTPTTLAYDGSGAVIGEPLIGSPQNAEEAYTDFINQALKAAGKEPL
ncbi:MAG: TlpA family protein disulfide reductase [Lachnospiraceae bacterium]|nr:TlpA family protein disulfide reductase [Lachnospiraceae bacterium]